MDKMTIVFGIAIIFFTLVAIICEIQVIKINYKLKESKLMQLLISQTRFALNNAGLMIDANEKIIHFKLKQNDMDLDLSPLDDAVELNFKVIDSIHSNVSDLHKFINAYQKEETEKKNIFAKRKNTQEQKIVTQAGKQNER